MTPAALISSSADVEDQVTTAARRRPRDARSQNSCGSSSSCRASTLSAGTSKISSSGPRRLPAGTGWRSRNSGSSAIPSRSRRRRPPRAPPPGSARHTSRPTSRGDRRGSGGPAARDVPDQRAVRDDRQPVRSDVLEDLLGPAQGPAGDEHHRDAPRRRGRRSRRGCTPTRCRRCARGCRRGRWRPAAAAVSPGRAADEPCTSAPSSSVPRSSVKPQLGEDPEAGPRCRAATPARHPYAAPRPSRRAARAAPRWRTRSRGPPRPGRSRPRPRRSSGGPSGPKNPTEPAPWPARCAAAPTGRPSPRHGGGVAVVGARIVRVPASGRGARRACRRPPPASPAGAGAARSRRSSAGQGHGNQRPSSTATPSS